MAITNLPAGQTYQVLHLGNTEANRAQLAIGNDSDRAFIRRSGAAAWSSWLEMGLEIPTASLPGGQAYQIMHLGNTASNRAQLAISNSSDRAFIRGSNGAAWANWRGISLGVSIASLPAGQAYQIMHLGSTATNRAQLAISNSSDRAFIRRSNGGTWLNWRGIGLGSSWVQDVPMLVDFASGARSFTLLHTPPAGTSRVDIPAKYYPLGRGDYAFTEYVWNGGNSMTAYGTSPYSDGWDEHHWLYTSSTVTVLTY